MSDFDLSMRITADGDDAVAEAGRLENSLEGVARAQQQTATSARALQGATAASGSAATSAGAAHDRLGTELTQEAAAAGAATTATQRQTAATQAATAATQRYTQSQGAARASMFSFGQQIQDITQGIALGINPLTILAQQGGQTATALSGLGGVAGRVGTFFAGPWGSIIIAATTVLGYMTLGLTQNADAQKKAADGADSFGRAQSSLAGVIDLVTGKLTTQNQVLIESIRLNAIRDQQAAKGAERDARNALRSTRTSIGLSGLFSRSGAGAAGLESAFRGETFGDSPELRSLFKRFDEGAISIKDARIELEKLGQQGKTAGQQVEPLLDKLIDLGIARNDQEASQAIIDALDGKGLDPRLRKKGPKPKKPKSTAARDEFGRDAADRIDEITARFTNTPAQVIAVNKAVADLNDMIDDLGRKKPPNFKELIADAERAKVVVADGINKPYFDYLDAQSDALAVQRLMTAGRQDEAAATKIIQSLEDKMGPLSDQRKDAVLATVQALKEEERQLDIIREKQQKYLTTLGEIRGIITNTIATGNLSSIPGALIGSFRKLLSETLTERLFGDAFRELEDQITGADRAKDATERMAKAVDKASSSLSRLDQAARKAATSVAAAKPGEHTLGGEPISDELFNLLSQGNGVTGAGADGGPDIVVNGKKREDPVKFFQQSIGKLAEGVLGKETGQVIGKVAGKAIGGAAVGSITNSIIAPIGKALGIKTSNTGAQIGGAIGSFIPIPGGDIIGSIIGSVVGGLFKKTKVGSATFGLVDGGVGVTGTAGNSASRIKSASGFGDSLGSSLSTIAQQLGGDLGNFSVSIGVRDKNIRVDTSGSGNTKTKKGAIDFGQDEAAAVMFALADAIADGAITGLSPAVAAAIKSNKDVNKAVAEALKVQEIEDLIGGIGNKTSRMFKDFDREAAERVRLAKKYGLDVIAIEKVNAEERAKLLEDTIRARVGSLQDFLKNIKYGDLFEGDAATRRSEILKEIEKVRGEAEDGVDGAADTLAQLYRQLIETSRDAFGTAGSEFTTDRSQGISSVEKIIQIENDRIKTASEQSATQTAAMQAANQLSNEANDLAAAGNQTLAQILAAIQNSGGLVGANTGRFVNLV